MSISSSIEDTDRVDILYVLIIPTLIELIVAATLGIIVPFSVTPQKTFLAFNIVVIGGILSWSLYSINTLSLPERIVIITFHWLLFIVTYGTFTFIAPRIW